MSLRVQGYRAIGENTRAETTSAGGGHPSGGVFSEMRRKGFHGGDDFRTAGPTIPWKKLLKRKKSIGGEGGAQKQDR